jgi:pimeloyl-ACP methyl ester carboxylesterase
VNSTHDSPELLTIEDLGEGEPLVLVHGLGATRAIWGPVSQFLTRRRRMIAPDLPGFGDSPPPADGFSFEAAADSIAATLEARGVSGIDLVGHSLGGAVALTMAGRRPSLVRRLVLCAPAGFRPRSRPVADALASSLPAFLAARRLVGGRMAASTAGRRVLLAGALHDPGRLSPEQARMMVNASRTAGSLKDAAAAAISADLIGELGRIEPPIGLLWGGRDRLLPVSAADAILERVPGTALEIVPDAGHVVQMERPQEFAAALDRVLERIGGAPPEPG